MNIILAVHSILRWGVALLALYLLARSLWGWTGRQKYTRMDRGMMSGLAGLVDMQLLLGIVLLVNIIAQVGFSGARTALEHAFTMIVVAVVAHVPMRWRNDDSHVKRFRNNFFTILVMLVLVILGVFVIRPGWSIWMTLT